LLGDGKYGGGAGEIALWSYRLSFPHPVTHKAMSFTQPPSGEPWCDFSY
ncbi:MAG: RNA pseudouridine synthase, partial [Oscillospiraceae bacterium]|nr:RNA pseudouridine synthase [Oscillospiraceae bacterium]